MYTVQQVQNGGSKSNVRAALIFWSSLIEHPRLSYLAFLEWLAISSSSHFGTRTTCTLVGAAIWVTSPLPRNGLDVHRHLHSVCLSVDFRWYAYCASAHEFTFHLVAFQIRMLGIPLLPRDSDSVNVSDSGVRSLSRQPNESRGHLGSVIHTDSQSKSRHSRACVCIFPVRVYP